MFTNKIQQDVSRRHFFQDCGVGLGKVALAGLLTGHLGSSQSMAAEVARSSGARNPLAPRPSHFPGKAKRFKNRTR